MKKPDWKLWLNDKTECKFWMDNYIRKKILKKSSNESRLHLKRTDHNLTFANWIIEKHKDEIPGILVQMVQVGEETGSLGAILKTLTDFYKREVDDAVDTLVGLIEPVMIVVLGLGVGILLVSVLMPIYNMASSIS